MIRMQGNTAVQEEAIAEFGGWLAGYRDMVESGDIDVKGELTGALIALDAVQKEYHARVEYPAR